MTPVIDMYENIILSSFCTGIIIFIKIDIKKLLQYLISVISDLH